MHRDLCHGKEGLCDTMKPTKGTTLLQYLRKVDFKGERFLVHATPRAIASPKGDQRPNYPRAGVEYSMANIP